MVRYGAFSRFQSDAHPHFHIFHLLKILFRGLRALDTLLSKRQRVALVAVGCLSSLGAPVFQENSLGSPSSCPIMLLQMRLSFDFGVCLSLLLPGFCCPRVVGWLPVCACVTDLTSAHGYAPTWLSIDFN